MDGRVPPKVGGGPATSISPERGGMCSTGEGWRRGGSRERRRLGPRRMTPSSVDEDARPKRTSVRFSLDRGDGEGA